MEPLPVLSNLLALPASWIAFVSGEYLAAFFNLMAALFSSYYHLCKSYRGVCLVDFDIHQNGDFLFAELAIVTTAILLVYWPPHLYWLKNGSLILGAGILLILRLNQVNGMVAHGAVAIGALLVPMVYWILFWVRHKRFPRYKWPLFTAGTIISTMGIYLFIIQNNWVDAYWLIHSVWHAFVFLGQYFFLQVRYVVPATLVHRKLPQR